MIERSRSSGGVYIPPFKLARLQKQVTDTKSVAYQRQMWEALRKSLTGLVNKVNVLNITELVQVRFHCRLKKQSVRCASLADDSRTKFFVLQELFRENLVWGRGLFCRSLIRAQLASPGFTAVYASLLCIVNSKLPDIGELVIKRVILQFRSDSS